MNYAPSLDIVSHDELRMVNRERELREEIARKPDTPAAYAQLASLLRQAQRVDEALALLEDEIARRPSVIWPLAIKAAVLTAERRAEEAVDAHGAVVALAPPAALPWINYAHALKTAGRTAEAVSAYRKALQIEPANGTAWWGLADLRTVRFDATDVSQMVAALSAVEGKLQHVHLQFALGKGLGDLGDYEMSFRHYQTANRLRAELAPYDAEATRVLVDSMTSLLTPKSLAKRHERGYSSTDPIFIVGMPRSGSTLVEQILASHPLVEGAGELFELSTIAAQMGATPKLARLSGEELRRIGETYLQQTRRHRRIQRPFFTDKMPSNWQFVPLILLALPNARIIDVRRHAPACGLSAFTSYFNLQTSFPTTLAELADYYQTYCALMDQMEAVAPGQILRVNYERMVDDSDAEIRRLLHLLGLPFDVECLRFHTNKRAIHTPSAQQVRQPIYRSALDHWRNYERWLTPFTSMSASTTD
jgi:tetratricopeptide (TPR) repeat protein